MKIKNIKQEGIPIGFISDFPDDYAEYLISEGLYEEVKDKKEDVEKDTTSKSKK